MADDSVMKPIVAALQAGDAVQGENLCRRALDNDPDDAEVLLLLGLALQRQARPRDALQPFARLTELYPDNGMHWGNYATALARVGDVEAAERAADNAVRLTPEQPGQLEQLGVLQLQLGKPREAQDTLLRACELDPTSAAIRIHAARACVACRDQQAEELVRPWREWLPLSHDLQVELANLLVQVGEPWDALELVEDLVQRTPTDWPMQLLLAKVYERVNRLEQAESKLQWVAAMTGSDQSAAKIRHEIEIQKAQLAMRRRDHALARTLLENAGPGNDADDGHWFSLAKACDQLGDAPATMAALETGHRMQIEALQATNPQLLEPGAPLLPGVDDRVSADDHRAWPDLRGPDAGQSPVFVVGFPRSGTTLLEQMLDAHPRLQSMDERPFLNMLSSRLADVGIEVPADLHRLTQRDCDELRKGYVLLGCARISRRWDARLVDKNPLNMLWLPMIQRLFPRAKFILALRHPCDVVWSCYLQNFHAAPLVAACRSLTHLARAYVAAMRNWLHHVEVFGPDVMVSRYEDLVADPGKQSDAIARFLDLGDADAMLQFATRAREKGYIRTPSYTQVVEPITTRAVGHWQQYRGYFSEVLPILQPMLDHWHYDLRPAAASTEA